MGHLSQEFGDGSLVPTGISGDYDVRSRDMSAAGEAMAREAFHRARIDDLMRIVDDPNASDASREAAENQLSNYFYEDGLTGLA